MKTFFLSIFCLVAVSPNHGQQIVFDPSSFGESIAQTSVLLDTVANQIVMIELAIKNAERQVKMLTQLPKRIINTAVNLVEDRIETIQKIQKNVEKLVEGVESMDLSFEALFETDKDYVHWFNPSLNPEERSDLVKSDLEKMKLFEALFKKRAAEAEAIKRQMEEDIKEGAEQIAEVTESLSNSETSVIAQLQGFSTLFTESYNLFTYIARDLSLLAQSFTEWVYIEEKKGKMADGIDNKLLEDCPPGYYKDPFTLDCVKLPSQSQKEIFTEGMTEPRDAEIYKQDQDRLGNLKRRK